MIYTRKSHFISMLFGLLPMTFYFTSLWMFWDILGFFFEPNIFNEDNFIYPISYIAKQLSFFRVEIFSSIILYFLARSYGDFYLSRAVFIFPVYFAILINFFIIIIWFFDNDYEWIKFFVWENIPIIVFYFTLSRKMKKQNNNNGNVESNKTQKKIFHMHKLDISNISIKLDERSIFWIAPSLLLLIGIFDMPIEYYTLLRLVVSVCCVYFLIAYIKQETKTRSFIFGFFAILYNPIVPVYLYDKSIWIILNVITIILLVYYGVILVQVKESSKDTIYFNLSLLKNLFNNRSFQSIAFFLIIVFLVTTLRLYFDGRLF